MLWSAIAIAAQSVEIPAQIFALQVTAAFHLLQIVKHVFKELQTIKIANVSKYLAQHAKLIQSALILQTKPAFVNNHWIIHDKSRMMRLFFFLLNSLKSRWVRNKTAQRNSPDRKVAVGFG